MRIEVTARIYSGPRRVCSSLSLAQALDGSTPEGFVSRKGVLLVTIMPAISGGGLKDEKFQQLQSEVAQLVLERGVQLTDATKAVDSLLQSAGDYSVLRSSHILSTDGSSCFRSPANSLSLSRLGILTFPRPPGESRQKPSGGKQPSHLSGPKTSSCSRESSAMRMVHPVSFFHAFTQVLMRQHVRTTIHMALFRKIARKIARTQQSDSMVHVGFAPLKPLSFLLVAQLMGRALLQP